MYTYLTPSGKVVTVRTWKEHLIKKDMIIEPPKTLEDFQRVRESILELMANPYADYGMLCTLGEKLIKVDEKIDELSRINKH
jgi:hypothetical protein